MRTVFWIAYSLWALVPAYLLIGSLLPSIPPMGIAPWLAAFCAACILPILFLPIRSSAAFWTAMIVLAVGWVPLLVQMIRRVYVAIFQGMEGPGGYGSPMAFLFAFLLEVVFAFGPMTILLLFGIVIVAWQRWSPNQRLQLTGDARV